jgi:hypothetical protein
MPFLAFLALLGTSIPKNIHILDCFSDCLGAAGRWLHVGTKHFILIILSLERHSEDTYLEILAKKDRITLKHKIYHKLCYNLKLTKQQYMYFISLSCTCNLFPLWTCATCCFEGTCMLFISNSVSAFQGVQYFNFMEEA